MKLLFTALTLIVFASIASADISDATPAISPAKHIAEVHAGYESANTWHGGGRFVQAKTTDGKYFVYYVNRLNCTESGAKLVMAILLSAKGAGSPVKFNATKADASSIGDANNATFRDIFLVE